MKDTDDMERDRHLQQALKHAPDAARSAPPQLSARIIEAAHRAVAEQKAAARHRPGWWLAWLQPRPGSWSRTGAFATVLMAVLLTLMWPAPPPSPTTDGEMTVAQAPATALESTPPAAPAAAPLQPAQPQVLTAPAARAPAEQPRKRAVAAPMPPPSPVDGRSPAAPPLPAAAPAADAAELAPARVAPAEPAAAVAAAPAPLAAAKAGAATGARSRADAMPAFGTQSLQAGLAPLAQPGLAAWLQRQPPNLSWRIDGAAPAAASLPWLQRLAASTGGRWRPVSATAALPGATTLQLLSADGEPVAELVLHADHVRWCDQAGACSRSLLTPEVMDTLQKELPR
jgi:hypothetical protein